jgi:hypothetical protein
MATHPTTIVAQTVSSYRSEPASLNALAQGPFPTSDVSICAPAIHLPIQQNAVPEVVRAIVVPQSCSSGAVSAAPIVASASQPLSGVSGIHSPVFFFSLSFSFSLFLSLSLSFSLFYLSLHVSFLTMKTFFDTLLSSFPLWYFSPRFSPTISTVAVDEVHLYHMSILNVLYLFEHSCCKFLLVVDIWCRVAIFMFNFRGPTSFFFSFFSFLRFCF